MSKSKGQSLVNTNKENGEMKPDEPSIIVRPIMEGRALSVPVQGTAITRCPTNIDATTLAGKALLIKAQSPGDIELAIGQPVRMLVTQWVVFPDCVVDEDSGEVSEFARTVLFDAEGQCMRLSSAHAPLRLCSMLELFTAEEWAQGIPLILSARKSKRGRIYHDVQIDTETRYGI